MSCIVGTKRTLTRESLAVVIRQEMWPLSIQSWLCKHNLYVYIPSPSLWTLFKWEGNKVWGGNPLPFGKTQAEILMLDLHLLSQGANATSSVLGVTESIWKTASPPSTLNECSTAIYWALIVGQALWACLYAKLIQLCPTLCDPRTIAHQAPLSMGFSRLEYWSGLLCPPEGIFLTQGLNLGLLHCKQILYPLSHQGSSTVSTQGARLTIMSKKSISFLSSIEFLV